MSDDIYIDVNYLTESERDIILQVLAKDDELRRQEKKRLGQLKTELDTIKFSGLEAHQLSPNARVCARCKEEFGALFNTGAFCPKCKVKVCKDCRAPNGNSWLCVLCSKVREVKARSGAWFFESEPKKVQKPTLYGSVLLRASLKRAKKTARKMQNPVIVEPPPPPIINLNLKEHENLRRPVPVHMSPLKEPAPTTPDETPEHTEGYEGEYEINSNYKQTYSKAVPMKVHTGIADDEEDHRSMTSSGSSTPSPEDDPDQTMTTHIQVNGNNETPEEQPIFDYLNGAEEERPVFDYLKEELNSSHGSEAYSDGKYDGQMEGLDGYTRAAVNGHVMREYEAEEKRYSYQSSDTGTYHDAEDHRSQDSLLGTDSMDTIATGEFVTPRETPGHSDANTPTQSSPEPTDSDTDTREVTPTMMQHGGDETPDDRSETYSSSAIVPPQIVTTDVSDDEGAGDEPDGRRRNTGGEEPEDIDQAFAEYGVDMNSQKLAQRFDMGSRESIVSYYSDAGEGHFGNIAVTGEIQLGLLYDFKKEQLELQIHRAKDIAPVDTKKNKSDPYIKVYLLPDKTKGGKRKTKTKKHTLNPSFDEILTFKVGFDEMLTRTMWLAVWNHDRFGHNDFLGEVMLPLGPYEESGFSWSDPSAQWYPLRERRPEPSLMKYCGEIVVSLKYIPPQSPESGRSKKKKKKSDKGELLVVIKEARNLPAKDANGFSDPFCKSYLLPDKGKKSKRKTPTVKKNLNPKWKFPFTYDDVTLEDLMDRALELTVWDWDRGSSNDFLGGVRLGMGTKMEKWDDAEGEEITAWQTMLDFPNEWHDSTLALSSSLSRFYDHSTQDSDPEAKDKTLESSAETYERIPGSEKSSDSDSTAYDNMAYVDCHDDEANKSLSFLKSFPDFVRNKFPGDKKEEAQTISNIPEQNPSNYGSISSSPEEKSTSSNESDVNTRKPESEPIVPQVTTIITEPPSPTKESQKKAEPKPNNSRKGDRRNTENVLFFEGATLSPTLDTRRRHSTDMVSVPKPINEELIEDFVRRDSPPVRPRKKSTDDTDGRHHRRKQNSLYSPRSARKKLDTAKSKSSDQRRPTLAELAKEAGYQPPPREHGENMYTDSLMVNHERKISASSDEERDSANTGGVITGELYLTLEYCIKTKTFSIHVHSANNLGAKKHTADPYVKTYLLPDKKSKKKTRIIRDNLNPEFDEILKYNIGYDELLTRSLSITVWNDRIGVNDFLGEVLIHMSSYVDAGNSMENAKAKWHRLCRKTDREDSSFVQHPELILSLKYVTPDKVKRKGKRVSIPAKGELHLHIMEAKNLPGKDADGMSDPFCKISLLPDKKGKTRHKTAIVKRTLNPSWDYNVSYEDLSQEDLRERVLEISLWDHDIASRDEFLGGVRLGLGTSLYEWDDSNEDEAQIWHTMLTRTNVWIQVVVPLRPNMDSLKH